MFIVIEREGGRTLKKCKTHTGVEKKKERKRHRKGNMKERRRGGKGSIPTNADKEKGQRKRERGVEGGMELKNGRKKTHASRYNPHSEILSKTTILSLKRKRNKQREQQPSFTTETDRGPIAIQEELPVSRQ